MKYKDTVILLFSRAPIPGEVNTRLIDHLGADGAANLQKELVNSRLEKFYEAGLCDTQLWCSPDCEHEFFLECKNKYGIELYNQEGVDLGARMSSAIESALKSHKYVVLVGSDAPVLGVEEIESAIKALKSGSPVVLVPAEDGGYVLIGMTRHYKEIFLTVPWGTDRVLNKTRGNIIALGLKHVELEPSWDIDRPEDYERYLKLGKE